MSNPTQSKEKKPNPQVKSWEFTQYGTNQERFDENNISAMWGIWCIQVETKKDKIEYLCAQVEKCPKTGSLHIQGSIIFCRSTRRGSLQKILRDKCHCEPTEEEDNDYTKKEKSRYIDEHGKCFRIEIGKKKLSGQGKRNDITHIVDNIRLGVVTTDDIAMTNPMKYHQFGRTFHKVEDICMRKKFRTEMTEGFWLWGPTNVGKSHHAYLGYNSDKCYNHIPLDNGWWDGYCQQETVIINDFRGQIQFSELLCLCDKWPHSVKRRCREPIPFMSKRIIITSCHPPEEIYKNILKDGESLNQLTRRFKIIKVEPGWAGFEVLGGNTDIPSPKEQLEQ